MFRFIARFVVLLYLVGFSARSDEGTEFFESHIRPLLVERCYDCHSVEAGKQKGGLLLDSKWGWESGGDSGPAVIPGDVEGSLLIDAVRRTENLVDGMPPKTNLSKAEIALLEKWVEMGAPDPREKVESATGLVDEFDLEKRRAAQWNWHPIQAPSVPEGVNPIDYLVGQKLEEKQLKPAMRAEEHLIRRRLFFDLIGLPPGVMGEEEPAELNELVDQLLESPHFGEKWARHWMDLVRYAETCGHEFDYPISGAHQYRDYLIRAYNEDVPYDQFLHEHVAGDLMPNPRVHPSEKFNESVLATAFWYFHDATHAPTDVLQDEADHIYNQLDVFGKAFLGLTIACARCHDHKFDPISTADYYALSGYLHGSQRTLTLVDRDLNYEEALEEQKKLAVEQAEDFRNPTKSPEVGAHFLAAVRALQAQPPGDPWSGIVFDDFEEGNGGTWAPTENAFARVKGTDTGASGFRGEGVLSSAQGGSELVGSVESPEFLIEKPFVNFLIGGGKDRNTGFELRVNGRVERQANGQNSNEMAVVSWDVESLIGKTASLRIFDNRQEEWGYLTVDHIVFSAVSSDENQLPVPDDRILVAVAKEGGLELDQIRAWCQVLAESSRAKDAQTADAFFNRWMTKPDALQNVRRDLINEQAKLRSFRENTDLYDDFSGEGLSSKWNASASFVANGESQMPVFTSLGTLAEPGTVSNFNYGTRRPGSLRSESLTIPEGRIFVRARIQKGVARVVPDNYYMARYSTLLFNGTVFREQETVDSGQYSWYVFDRNLSKYWGHKGWLEFFDEKDGYCAIDEIRFGKGAESPPRLEFHPLLGRMLGQEFDLADSEAVAGALDEVWGEIEVRLRAGAVNQDDAVILNWMIGKGMATVEGLWGSDLARRMEEGRKLAQKLPAPELSPTMAQGTPESIRVHIRGSHKTLGEVVANRNLEGLGGDVGNRLELARALTRPENPMTSRVIVNRLWHHLFGRGLVATPDDFGPMGQLPSHPELLDWLALDFQKNGWSVKHTIRQIVTSSTYQQSSVAHPDLAEELLKIADPTNQLLHRAPVRRLQAEAIRDSILAVSGRWDRKLLGPSVATHRTSFMTGRGGRGSGPLDGNGRRSVYLSVYRNFLNPFLLTFDMPSPFGPKGRRSNSNVPAQALALMNDPFVHQQAAYWVDQLDLASPPRETIRQMYGRAIGLEPTEEQVESLLAFFQGQPDFKVAWQEIAHLLFNTKEFSWLR